jgi:hypothetical protein
MVISFGIWKAFILEIVTALTPLLGRTLLGFPGTLMIICGWIPVIAWKLFSDRKDADKVVVQESVND